MGFPDSETAPPPAACVVAPESRPVLVAAVPLAAQRLSRQLPDQRLVVPATLAEAQAALARERFSLAVMGVHFAESRMFDLLSFARGSALNRDVPILCVLGVRRKLSPLTVRLLEETINAMRGCAFFNLTAIPDDEAGNALVRRTLMDFLQPPLSVTPVPEVAPRPFP
jgi:hypothetical protein